MTKELSIFIDESGDFGPTKPHSPYYFITMVFHDQNNDITTQIKKLDSQLIDLGLTKPYVHSGPLIRKEREYYHMSLLLRRKILSRMLQFARNTNVKYKYFYVEKQHVNNQIELIGKLSEQIASFIKNNLNYFYNYDTIKVYYDNGQSEVTKILSSVFNSFITGTVFHLVKPSDYKLFQTADFYCTMELIRLKMDHSNLSRSEKLFFESTRNLKKNYLKTIDRELFK